MITTKPARDVGQTAIRNMLRRQSWHALAMPLQANILRRHRHPILPWRQLITLLPSNILIDIVPPLHRREKGDRVEVGVCQAANVGVLRAEGLVKALE